jgi:hypothetical protein
MRHEGPAVLGGPRHGTDRGIFVDGDLGGAAAPLHVPTDGRFGAPAPGSVHWQRLPVDGSHWSLPVGAPQVASVAIADAGVEDLGCPEPTITIYGFGGMAPVTRPPTSCDRGSTSRPVTPWHEIVKWASWLKADPRSI